MTSWLIMRIQPEETFLPIVPGSTVPWIRKSVSLLHCQRYIARAPSGLPGPPCLLFTNRRDPGPTETFAADTDAIAQCLSAPLHEIKEVMMRIDDNRHWRF